MDDKKWIEKKNDWGEIRKQFKYLVLCGKYWLGKLGKVREKKSKFCENVKEKKMLSLERNLALGKRNEMEAKGGGRVFEAITLFFYFRDDG